MKVNRLEHKSKYSCSNEPDELNEDELKVLEQYKIDEIWYWYNIGSYSGDGYMLCRKGKKYLTLCLSHCSCYGPTSDISIVDSDWKSLSSLSKKASAELNEETEILFSAAKEGGK